MPASLAHNLFGQQVYENSPPQTKALIQHHKPYFDLGLQGPDIFFYHYEPLRRSNVNIYGSTIHKKPGVIGLRWAYEHIQTSAQRAYWFGLLCHFVLDCYCHPYIYQFAPHISEHFRLEAAYDRFCLDKNKRPILAQQIYQKQLVDPAKIAVLWANRTEIDVAKSIECRRWVLWMLTYAKQIKVLEGWIGKKGVVSSLCLPQMVAVDDHFHMHNLEMLTDEAVTKCQQCIVNIQNDPVEKWFEEEVFWRNYNGEACIQ